MSRSLTALFAAFEAVLVAAIGLAIPLVPLTILWGFQFGLALDWVVFWRSAVDIWMLGHGVDITFSLDPAFAAGFGVPGAEVPFTVTLTVLGFALLTALLAVRAGRRVSETDNTLLGAVVSLATFAVVAFLVGWSASIPEAQIAGVQAVVMPTLVFALGLVIGVLRARRDQEPGRRDLVDRLRLRAGRWPAPVRAGIGAALRGGLGAAATILAGSAIVLAGALVFSFARIIALYQSLHTEVLGGVAITLGQLALLPNLVVYTMSWLVGPGFSLGTGSSISPLGTQLGPVPAIPVLGALPEGDLALGFLGLLVPVLAGFLVGILVRPKLDAVAPVLRVPVAIGIGLVAGLVLGLLAAASGGSAGPGRLVDVGPPALQVGAVAAIIVAVSSLLGMLSTATLPRRR